MTRAASAFRLGCVKYLNARPLIHGWSGDVHFDHPAALCRMLSEGELDVAFVSSFEFLRNPLYWIVDSLCVASDGAVYSVFVAHREPLGDISEIRVDPNSRTSVNLLRCVLAQRGLDPRLVSDDADARLLIGDQAIHFRHQHGGEYEIWDLGAEWKRTTGLPFVFALWLIRPETPNAAAIAEDLRDTCRRNLAALNRVIGAQQDFPAEFCDRYFRQHLRFNLGDPEKAGLLHFRALCEKHGLLPPNAAPLRLI